MKKSLIFHRIYAKKISFILHTAFKKKKSLNFIFLEILNIYTVYTLFLLKLLLELYISLTKIHSLSTLTR